MPPPDPRSFAATILRASFEGVEFPVASADTTTSHDGQGHKAYLVPGADFEPTGLNEDHGTLTVPLHNGVDGMEDLYPATFRRLLAAVKANPIGAMVHPTRGRIRAFVSVFHDAFDASTQDGITVQLQWAEHNGNSTDQATDPATAPRQRTAAACVLAAERVDAEIVALGNPLLMALLIAGYIGEQFAQLDSVVQTAGSIQAIFALMQDRVDELREYPEFTVALGFGVAGALSGLGVSLVGTLSTYISGLSTASGVVTQVNQTVWDIAEASYGTVRGVEAILDANTIPDPMNIPPGTELIIPPVDAVPRPRDADLRAVSFQAGS